MKHLIKPVLLGAIAAFALGCQSSNSPSGATPDVAPQETAQPSTPAAEVLTKYLRTDVAVDTDMGESDAGEEHFAELAGDIDGLAVVDRVEHTADHALLLYVGDSHVMTLRMADDGAIIIDDAASWATVREVSFIEEAGNDQDQSSFATLSFALRQCVTIEQEQEQDQKGKQEAKEYCANGSVILDLEAVKEQKEEEQKQEEQKQEEQKQEEQKPEEQKPEEQKPEDKPDQDQEG